jgi:hypothetical protein
MRKNLIVALTAGLSGLGISAASAAPVTLPTAADVDILEQIVITELASLNFGTIDKPSTGSQTFTVAPAGGITDGAGDGSSLAGDAPGSYGVAGTDGAYTFSVSTTSTCSGAGLSLALMTHNSGSTLDETVGVGGELTVTSGAASGPSTCAYTVAANY